MIADVSLRLLYLILNWLLSLLTLLPGASSFKDIELLTPSAGSPSPSAGRRQSRHAIL
jgi:hypothetical protein